MTFKTTVRGPNGPIEGAFVQANDEMTGLSFCRSTDGGGYADVSMPGAKVGDRVTIVVFANGYDMQVMGDAFEVTAADHDLVVELTQSFRSRVRVPALLARAPLGPFDRATTDPDNGAPLPVSTVLTQTPPPRGTLRYWRANSFGVTVPGLPWVEGGNTGPSQERVLSWFLDRYGSAFEDRIFRANLERGLDRYVLSPPDSIKGRGLSLRDYVAMSKRVKDAGLKPAHMLLSKVYDGGNPDPASLDPLLDALLDADVIPLASIGWELNLFVSPVHLQRLIDHVAARLPISDTRALYVHFSPHYVAWQPDRPGGSGADFWQRQGDKLTGVLYQCQPYWSAGMMQARINDGLVRLVAGGLWGLGQTFDLVAWETIATEQFENRADEDRGDLIGLETLCSPGPMPVMGFGNGARYPDGSPI